MMQKRYETEVTKLSQNNASFFCSVLFTRMGCTVETRSLVHCGTCDMGDQPGFKPYTYTTLQNEKYHAVSVVHEGGMNSIGTGYWHF